MHSIRVPHTGARHSFGGLSGSSKIEKTGFWFTQRAASNADWPDYAESQSQPARTKWLATHFPVVASLIQEQARLIEDACDSLDSAPDLTEKDRCLVNHRTNQGDRSC